MTKKRIPQSFRSHNDPLNVVWKRSSIEPNEISTRWWSNMYRSETAFCNEKLSWWPGSGSWIASFRKRIISTTPRGFIRKMYWLTVIVYWATFWQSTQDKSSNDITFIIRLWAETEYSSLIMQKGPYDFLVYFADKIGETWVDVMSQMTCIMTYRWNQYCWLLKMIIICGKRISTNYYNAWCHW